MNIRKFSEGINSALKEKPVRQLHKRLKSKWIANRKAVIFCLIFALVWNAIPVTANVSDNLQSAVAKVLGQRNDVTTAEGYQNASLSAKLNYLEGRIEQLEQNHEDEMTAIDNIYMVAASNAYSGSQIKSTQVASVSPKQVTVTWNCTQDHNCADSTASSDALSDWASIEKFNIYYGTSAKASQMTLAASVPADNGKLFYQNYSYTVSGLDPNTTYYFWVTSVMADDVQLSDTSAVRTIKTPTLASAQVTNLKSTPNAGTALDLTWSCNYSSYVTYKVYWGTSALSVNSGTAANATTSSKSYTITGLTAGKTYYVAVCAVLKDGNTWVGNTGTVNASNGNYITAMTCPTGTFATASSWADVQLIAKCGRADDQFTVGQTRTIDLSSMNAGTATVTLVNISSDGKKITCMITKYGGTTPTHYMNSSDTNNGSWSSSAMRTWLNGSDFYGKLPTDLKAVIASTTVTTGTYNGNASGGANQTTTDKLFLPSGTEIFGGTGGSNGSYCTTTEASATKQFQYFATVATTTTSRNLNNGRWWLRSPLYNNDTYFCFVINGSANYHYASYSCGVFPAFCIE